MLKHASSCGKCHRGHILVGNSWIVCQCLQNQILQSTLVASGMAPKTSYQDIRAFPLKLRQQVMLEVDPPKLSGRMIFMCGQQMIVLAYAILGWFIQVGHSGRIAQMEDLGDLWVAKRREEFRTYREAPVLVLEFGREVVSSVHRSVILHLLEFRSRSGFFTVVVWERALDDLPRKYDENLLALIKDGKRCRII